MINDAKRLTQSLRFNSRSQFDPNQLKDLQDSIRKAKDDSILGMSPGQQRREEQPKPQLSPTVSMKQLPGKTSPQTNVNNSSTTFPKGGNTFLKASASNNNNNTNKMTANDTVSNNNSSTSFAVTKAQSAPIEPQTEYTDDDEYDEVEIGGKKVRVGRGKDTKEPPSLTKGRVARVFSTDELRHLKRAWSTSMVPPGDPTSLPASNPASIHYSRTNSAPVSSTTTQTTNNNNNTSNHNNNNNGSSVSSLQSSNSSSNLLVGNSIHHSVMLTSSPVISNETYKPGSGANLSVDSISANSKDKFSITIISSSTFQSKLSRVERLERLGSKTYYLLDVHKNGVKSGMLLRNYKHFQRFHQKFELIFPSLARDTSLPKKSVISDKQDTLKIELQDYLNKLVSSVEIITSSAFAAFLDPTECPLLVFLGNPDKEGYLKISRGIIGSWIEVWVVVKHRRLYFYLDNNNSSVPVSTIRLQYSVVTATKDKNDTFELRSLSNNKDYIFRARDEQERNEWIVFLRNMKVKAIAESEAGYTMTSAPDMKPQQTARVSSEVLAQYATGGGLPSTTRGTSRQKNTDYFLTIKTEAIKVQFEEDSDSNIIKNPKKNTIKGATVEKLLEKLTEEEQDMDFVMAFLLTYRSFTNPTTLLNTCIQRFCYPPSKKNTNSISLQVIHPTQLRVITVLNKWVEINFHDFDEDDHLAMTLLLFIETELLGNTRFAQMGKKLKELLRKKVNNERSPFGTPEMKLPQAELPLLFSPNSFDLFDISPVELSRQLTLIEFAKFRAIEPKECLGQKWNKKEKDQAPHILTVIKRFNQMSNWVVTRIVLTEEPKARVAILKLFIEIANQCMQMNNYNTAMEIISGLNSSSVFRLNRTWEALSPSITSTFNKIKEQLAPEGSYKVLRELLHTRQPPCIPYFGVYLTDLVFIDDGNPDKIENNLVNFDKNYLLYKVIKEIQLYQQTPYLFQPVEEIQDYLTSSMTVLDEKDAYDLSLKYEPRDSANN